MGKINEIRVVPNIARPIQNTVYLIHNNWDDWFTYETEYQVIYCNEKLERYPIGFVKIGQREQTDRMPDLPAVCRELPDIFFSLGISEDYYEKLKGTPVREELLLKMRDIAFDLDLFEQVMDYDVTRISLMRDITDTTIRGQFHRMATGGARLTDYDFTYRLPSELAEDGAELSFNVECEGKPPSNIHVLIGKNGVGKTTILKRMLYAVEKQGIKERIGELQGDSFANVVFVSFSAFDMSVSAEDISGKELPVPYTFVGLVEKKRIKSGDALAKDFSASLYRIVKGTKRQLWNHAIEVLESDNTFVDLHIRQWHDLSSQPGWNELETNSDGGDKEDSGEREQREQKKQEVFGQAVTSRFSELSSGHKVILLTIAKLIELVEEKTLVLLDEPEEHLHPPLVSAFIRSLSDLLIYRNGAGIIATHSPVIVQEVPGRCVWILRRSGNEIAAERPCIETFGENAGVLTSEIFGYEVTNSGFHKMLKDVAERHQTYESAVREFHNELGKEARSILKAYMYEKESEKGSGKGAGK